MTDTPKRPPLEKWENEGRFSSDIKYIDLYYCAAYALYLEKERDELKRIVRINIATMDAADAKYNALVEAVLSAGIAWDEQNQVEDQQIDVSVDFERAFASAIRLATDKGEAE